MSLYIPESENTFSTLALVPLIYTGIPNFCNFLYLPINIPMPVLSINPTLVRSNTTEPTSVFSSIILSRTALVFGAENSSISPLIPSFKPFCPAIKNITHKKVKNIRPLVGIYVFVPNSLIFPVRKNVRISLEKIFCKKQKKF